MSRDIYFKDLPELTQTRILDSYGVSSPAELGLDTQPYATAIMDADGVGALAICNLKLRTA